MRSAKYLSLRWSHKSYCRYCCDLAHIWLSSISVHRSSSMSSWVLHLLSWDHIFITKTRLYNFDPLKPHFYIVKLGFTGVYLVFLFLLKNIDCGYSLEPPWRGGSYVYPQAMFWAEVWKISDFFLSENFQFLVVKFSVYLIRHVFVMCSMTFVSPNLIVSYFHFTGLTQLCFVQTDMRPLNSITICSESSIAWEFVLLSLCYTVRCCG